MSIEHSAVAVGHSTVTGPATPPERETAIAELRTAVSLLLDQLRQNEDQYEDGAELVEAAERVDAELAHEEPRRNILLRWLGFIAPGVQATAATAADVASIQQSVTALFR
ncbi:hypothetical protein ABZ923_00795 [Streptomyces sp. NPDC046881]|uniref:hypothetical protein n=1 Tax=Streptomyces sp. NPDC046881 TaxID=3155374 RepID=UPI0033D61D42